MEKYMLTGYVSSFKSPGFISFMVIFEYNVYGALGANINQPSFGIFHWVSDAAYVASLQEHWPPKHGMKKL